jgi:hypothetical protein
MRFPGRTKIVLDTEVNFNGTLFEPASPALGEMRRLWYLRDAQQRLVKISGRAFAARWHRQLNMINGQDHQVSFRYSDRTR